MLGSRAGKASKRHQTVVTACKLTYGSMSSAVRSSTIGSTPAGSWLSIMPMEIWSIVTRRSRRCKQDQLRFLCGDLQCHPSSEDICYGVAMALACC